MSSIVRNVVACGIGAIVALGSGVALAQQQGHSGRGHGAHGSHGGNAGGHGGGYAGRGAYAGRGGHADRAGHAGDRRGYAGHGGYAGRGGHADRGGRGGQQAHVPSHRGYAGGHRGPHYSGHGSHRGYYPYRSHGYGYYVAPPVIGYYAPSYYEYPVYETPVYEPPVYIAQPYVAQSYVVQQPRPVAPPPPPPAYDPTPPQAYQPAPLAQAAPAAPAQQARPAPRFDRVTLSARELFEFDKSTLRMPQRKLDEIAQALRENPEIGNVHVIGYTDRLGSTPYNQRLSQKRADAVKSYLVDRGVESKRLLAIGRGESNPIVDCADMKRDELIKCLEPNRRVEVEEITIERAH